MGRATGIAMSVPDPLVPYRVDADVQTARHGDRELSFEATADTVHGAPNTLVGTLLGDLGQHRARHMLVLVPAHEVGLAHALRNCQEQPLAQRLGQPRRNSM